MSNQEIKKSFYFDAAHFLPNLPKKHKCRRLHGHSFEVTLSIKGELNPKFGWILDFGEIKKIAKPVINQLDHRFLNEIKGLENPTSENIAKWIFKKLIIKLPLYSVEVKESKFAASIYYGNKR